MAKNISKIRILAWLALLPLVFSCGSEAEKERVRIELEVIDSVKRHKDSLETSFTSQITVTERMKNAEEFKELEAKYGRDSALKLKTAETNARVESILLEQFPRGEFGFDSTLGKKVFCPGMFDRETGNCVARVPRKASKR